MAKITLMPSGINGGISGGNGGKPGQRGICNGWSNASARRNSRFLMSVDCDQLYKTAFVYTLTVRKCPEDHKEWARLIDRLRKFLQRRGVVIDHWVTEWTQKGRPHLHGVAFVEPSTDLLQLMVDTVRHWLAMTEHLGTLSVGQYVTPVNDLGGWLAYVAKHAGRGFVHYQRQRETLPKGWQQTGRMWGKSGGWPTNEISMEIDRDAWFALRRMVRRYLCSEAINTIRRAESFGDTATAQKAKTSLRHRRRLHSRKTKAKGQVQGMQEWAPQSITTRMVAHLSQNDPYCVRAPQKAPERPSQILGVLAAEQRKWLSWLACEGE